MSRRLFATSTATASNPIETAAHHARGPTCLACTYVVPAVASSPKKRNTLSSPSPADAYGFGPPEYRTAPRIAKARNSSNHQLLARATNTPAAAATANEVAAAAATARGAFRPLAVNRTGPTRDAVSTPRFPSE